MLDGVQTKTQRLKEIGRSACVHVHARVAMPVARSYLLHLQLEFKQLLVPWWYTCDHFVAGNHHQGWATFNMSSEVIQSSLGFVCAFNRKVQEVLATFGRDKLTARVYQQNSILE